VIPGVAGVSASLIVSRHKKRYPTATRLMLQRCRCRCRRGSRFVDAISLPNEVDGRSVAVSMPTYST
jgi:hypothetical protein